MRAHREVTSPNHGPRPSGCVIDMLILHYTGMPDAAGALERLCDPEARVSAHYLVDRDGTVTALVPEERRAWHAGVASWRSATDINDRSVGIELVNPGHQRGYLPFPPEQMSVLVELCRGIISRHAIDPGHVLGHSDVAPARKSDPGELFDWRGLARAGIGWWPDPVPVPLDWRPLPLAGLRAALRLIGYDCPDDGGSETDHAVVRAFQSHWLPGQVSGKIDRGTAHRIVQLAGLLDRT